MRKAAFPRDEAERQAAVDQLWLTNPEIEAAFERIANLLAILLDVPISIFTVLDRERAFFRAVTGLDAREGPRDVSFCSHTILQQDVFVVSDARVHSIFKDYPSVYGPPHVVFYASVPVRAPNGQPVGTLCAIDTRPRDLTSKMRQTLLALGAVLEDELRLRLLSSVDHLTGLFNRRQFDDASQREWRRARRQGLPISLITLDIDYFKLFNDRFGHPAGDDCLRSVSEILRQECSRSGDQGFRIGGEEFAVILPGTDEAGARTLARRLGCDIRSLAIRHPGSSAGVVTVSMGVVTAEKAAAHALKSFLQCGDEALYEAKGQGRDCFVARVFEPPDSQFTRTQESGHL